MEEKKSKLLLAAVGVFSGIICGLFGIGAPLSAYIGKTTDDTQAFKANIGVVFVAENTFRLIAYTFMGIVTFAVIKRAVVLLPVMVVGMGLGIFSGRFLSEKAVKRLIIILLIISGMVLSLQNI